MTKSGEMDGQLVKHIIKVVLRIITAMASLVCFLF